MWTHLSDLIIQSKNGRNPAVNLKFCVCVCVCSYLIETSLVEGLPTARVITHLIRDGSFKSIWIADATLKVETLHGQRAVNVHVQHACWHKLSSHTLKHTHSTRHPVTPSLSPCSSLHFGVMSNSCFLWVFFLQLSIKRDDVRGKKKKKQKSTSGQLNFFALLWMLMKRRH